VIKKFKKRGLESSRIQRIPPFNVKDFIERITILENYCKLIKSQDEKYKILMKNQLLVTLVSTIEYNLKSFISFLIDEMDIEPKNILSEDSIEMNLDVLKQIKSSNLTKGRIISAHLDYFNSSKVYSIMNRINKLNYFKWIDNITDNPNTYDVFHNLYSERNDIIHNLSDTEKSLSDIDHIISISTSISTQLIAFTQLNLGIFDKNWSNERINEYYKSYFKNPPISIDKFKIITKKFRKQYAEQKPYIKK